VGQPWLDALLGTLVLRRRQLGGLIAAQLLDRGRVALEPGPRFGTPGNGFVRLNFGTSEAVLAMAIERTASSLT
jgi:cysteine-S-conjugate beta-lyase